MQPLDTLLIPAQVQRYLTPRMLQTAAEHKIVLKPIDYNQPLEPQGPFNVIIHKLRPNPSKQYPRGSCFSCSRLLSLSMHCTYPWVVGDMVSQISGCCTA